MNAAIAELRAEVLAKLASHTHSAPFVAVAGTQLSLDGRPFVFHSATCYGQMGRPVELVALAKQARLNTLELVNFEADYQQLPSMTSEATWTRVDRMIDECARNGLKVILNLSGYHHSLLRAGIKPTTYDWNPFLTFVTGRVNTVTGRLYRDDPTIAMIELVGEIPPPNQGGGTRAEMLAFFDRTLTQLRSLDPNHIMCTGGFSHLNDTSAESIDWQPIMALPNNQIVAFEINSYPDRDVTAPKVSAHAKQIGKPWFLAAFSSCQRPSEGSWDINAVADDAAGAAHHREMYEVARGRTKAATPSCGASFWNLAPQGVCDIGTQKPLTFAVVQQYAP